VINLLFNSVLLTILQIFSPEVTLIHDQVLINVGTYDPKSFKILSEKSIIELISHRSLSWQSQNQQNFVFQNRRKNFEF